jgi:predicted dinucleotide-binding enzyme
MDGRTDGQTDRQTDRQTGRQAGRQADTQTDVTKLTVPLSNFAKALKLLSLTPKELIDFVNPIPLKKTEIRCAVNHNKLHYSCQNMLHVLTILGH